MKKKMLLKTAALALSALLGASALAGCSAGKGSASGSKELNIYTWEGVFPQEVLDGFTEKTGIKVNYSNFDTDETMLSKLEAAKGGDYDFITADDYIIQTAIAEDLATKLDKDKLANLKNVNPVYQGQFYDPNDEYTTPYGGGVQTIVYNPDIVKKEITGYEDLWDASLKDSIGITSNFRVMNGMALKMMNESYNTQDVDAIAKAGDKMLELAPNIRMIQDDNLQDALISGEVSATVMYTSQVTIAMMSDPNLKVVFPKEGVGYGIMANFIPSDAPNKEAAYQFMDYLMDGKIAAKCSEYVGYYSTNLEGDKNISEQYRSFLTLPDDLDMSKSEMVQPIGADAAAEHEKVWTAFKSACGA